MSRRLVVAQHVLQGPVPSWMVAVAVMVRVRPDWVSVRAALSVLFVELTRTAIWHHVDAAPHEPELVEETHGVLLYVTLQAWVMGTPPANLTT
jgi:hypothetical protein